MADLIWPRYCPIADCARTSDRPGYHICADCYAALPFMEYGRACSICGLPIAAKVEHAFICEACATKRPAYEIARSALKYAHPIDELIKAFKYGKVMHLAEDFGGLIDAAARAFLDYAAVDVIVSVPLHPHRLHERGFNQSEILAAILARRLNRRLDAKSLVRIRDTAHQARSNAEERRKNLHGAFRVNRPGFIRGRTVLLVDDVMTSGATLDECARILRQSGACRVWGITLARALRD